MEITRLEALPLSDYVIFYFVDMFGVITKQNVKWLKIVVRGVINPSVLISIKRVRPPLKLKRLLDLYLKSTPTPTLAKNW